MTVTDFLKQLDKQEIRLWVDGDRLKYRSSKGRLTPEIQRMLRLNKSEIIDRLLQHQDEKNDICPLSYNQQSLWFLHQIAPDSACYNVALSCRIVSELQLHAMRKACRKLVKRHEILRTTYGINSEGNGQTYQVIHPEIEPDFYLVDVSGLSDEDLKKEVKAYHCQPFDLQNGPLLRLCLFQKSNSDYIFLMTIHHIACDGSSLKILLHDFSCFYHEEIMGVEEGLADMQWHYRDFVRLQQEMLQGKEGDRLRDFWMEHLSGGIPVMNLPIDYDRPVIQSFTGASYPFNPGDVSYAEIVKYVKSKQVTLYVFLMAVFQATLMRCCNQDEIIVGTPVTGRKALECKEICGHFVNMLAIRGDLSGGITLHEHLKNTQRVILKALDHQAYPFPLLVENLEIERNLSRSPVFQVMFNMLNHKVLGIAANFFVGASGDTQVDFGGLKILPWTIEQEEGQFDLVLEVIDTGESLACAFKYSTDLFKEETIASFANNFQRILHQFMENLETRLVDLALPRVMDKETKDFMKRDAI